MVETQEVFTSMHTTGVFQTHLVSNTLPITTLSSQDATILTSARIAHGHHAQRVKTAKTNVGLLTTRSIMLKTTT